MNAGLRWIVIPLFIASAAYAAPPAAPTFQELMDPSMFPLAQRGLRVESTLEDGETVRIRTTGAEILVDAPHGASCCRKALTRTWQRSSRSCWLR